MNFTQTLLEEVWNQENHARLFEVVLTNPFALLDLINLYKSFVPDLRFEATGVYWSANGHHYGKVQDIVPTGQAIRLEGSCKFTNWDILTFARQIGVSQEHLTRMLHPAADEIRMRAIWKTKDTGVLLFPALSLPGWVTWRRTIDELQQRRPVITFQLLANRWAIDQSEVMPNYSVKAETRAVTEALRRNGIRGPLDVVGHSAGGTLALDFALNYPRLIHTLTLIEPGPVWVLKPYDDQIKSVVEERMAAYSGIITPEKYGAFLRSTLGPGYEPQQSQFWPWLCLYRNNMKYRPALYEHSDDLRRLKVAEFPVLLIRGKDSDYYHQEIIRVLQATFPRTQTIELPGGHAPHQGEGHAAFLKLLGSFQFGTGHVQ